MKNNINKHILEAINKGINLALDNFDDDIQQQTFGNIKSINVAKNYLELSKYAVDLGLPSGTWWFKYNLGVDIDKMEKQIMPNVKKYSKHISIINNTDFSKYIDQSSLYYGKYYAWGETRIKKCYTWENYKLATGGYHALKKYNYNDRFGDIDNRMQLELKDDASYQNIKLQNFKCHIPTKEQIKELLKYTKYEFVTNYLKILNLHGIVFTGRNNQSIFIPCAGYICDDITNGYKSNGYIWTSTIANEEPDEAYVLYFNVNSNKLNITTAERFIGFSIRPVINL